MRARGSRGRGSRTCARFTVGARVAGAAAALAERRRADAGRVGVGRARQARRVTGCRLVRPSGAHCAEPRKILKKSSKAAACSVPLAWCGATAQEAWAVRVQSSAAPVLPDVPGLHRHCARDVTASPTVVLLTGHGLHVLLPISDLYVFCGHAGRALDERGGQRPPRVSGADFAHTLRRFPRAYGCSRRCRAR